MIIGLWNLEPHIINSAMMRVSQYHKDRSDIVEVYEAWKSWMNYDKIYVFSIFEFTPKENIPPNAICGGSGFDIMTKLPKDIEACDYDWTLYPNCDYSLIWFSTGCYRTDHPYCIVRRKEGDIKSVKPKNLNPNGKYVKVMDNNFFANPRWRDAIKLLRYWRQPCDFQGIDARLLDKEQIRKITFLTHEKRIKIAWDNPREDMLKHFRRILKHTKSHRFMCYVLIGYWSTEEQDVMRVEALRKLKIDPFVMLYDKKDDYQAGFARYVNHKAEYKSQTWDEYKKRKNVPNGPTAI